jgi:hypothetical protein
MSDYTSGTSNSESHKARLTVRDLLKKYFQTRRHANERSDSDNQASNTPVAPGDGRTDSGVEQQSHPGEVSGKPQRAIPSWCDPIDEKPRSARE